MNIVAPRPPRPLIQLARSVVTITIAVVVIIALGGVGCDENPSDRSAARLTERVTHDQAEQNKRLADATRSLTQESQQLVSAVAAAQNIVPVARTSAESVERLRHWASGRCLSADRPGLFQLVDQGAVSTSGPRRRASRGNPANY